MYHVFLLKIYLFIFNFCLSWVFIDVLRLSLVLTSELLIVVASLVAEHVSWGAWASVAAARE